jgi:hypothetical protein
MWLFPMSKTSNLEQLAKDFGNPPFSWFLLRAKVCKPQLRGNASGIVPLRLFVLRLSTTSALLLSSIKHWGIVPKKELLDRSRNSSSIALHIDMGISP